MRSDFKATRCAPDLKPQKQHCISKRLPTHGLKLEAAAVARFVLESMLDRWQVCQLSVSDADAGAPIRRYQLDPTAVPLAARPASDRGCLRGRLSRRTTDGTAAAHHVCLPRIKLCFLWLWFRITILTV